MAKYAVLSEKNEVLNVVEAESLEVANELFGSCAPGLDSEIGDFWDAENQTFTTPVVEVEPYEIPEEDLPEDVKMARLYPGLPEEFTPPVLPNP